MPSFEQPAPMRSIVSDDGSCLHIRFPLKRSVFLCLFLLFWFAGWSYAGWDTIHKLLRQFDWFTLFWLGGWALGELFGLYWLLRTAAGWGLDHCNLWLSFAKEEHPWTWADKKLPSA